MGGFYKTFKQLTGYNTQDIANKFKISKQHVHATFKNYSVIHISCVAYWFTILIDEKVAALENELKALKTLKQQINDEVMNDNK